MFNCTEGGCVQAGCVMLGTFGRVYLPAGALGPLIQKPPSYLSLRAVTNLWGYLKNKDALVSLDYVRTWSGALGICPRTPRSAVFGVVKAPHPNKNIF